MRIWLVCLACLAACDGTPSSTDDLAAVAGDLAAPPDASVSSDLAAPDLAASPLVDLATSTVSDGGAVGDAGPHVPRFVAKPLGLGNTVGRVYAISGTGGTVYFGGEYGVASTATQGASFSVNAEVVFVKGLAARATSLFAATESGLYVSSAGGPYTRIGAADGGIYGFKGIAGQGNDLFAVGPAGAIFASRDGGASFDWIAPPPSLSGNYQAAWVDGTTVLIAGEKSLRSNDRGVNWQAMPISGDAVVALWGTGADVWAVGGYYWGGTPIYFGEIRHSADRGATWTKQVGYYDTGEPELPLVDGPFFGVWGSSAGDVWVVGAGGTILRSSDQGASWSTVAISTRSTLRAVWGTSPTDVWVAGDNGIWHLE